MPMSSNTVMKNPCPAVAGLNQASLSPASWDPTPSSCHPGLALKAARSGTHVVAIVLRRVDPGSKAGMTVVRPG